MRRVAAAVLLVLVMAGAATAKSSATKSSPAMPNPGEPSSAERLFRAFDLFGNWAPDCKQAAAPDNPHVGIGLPETGIVLEQHDLGPFYAHNRYVILSARRSGREHLSVEVLFQQGGAEPERQRLVFRIRDHTRRTMFTQTQGEPARVKDGIALADGKPTPLLAKCE
jgi:hypothetical protein